MTQETKSPVTIESLDIEGAADVLPELRILLDGAYHDSHMYRDLGEDIERAPDPFRLFLARSQDRPIGVAVVEEKVHDAYDYLGLPPVHVKRFTVADGLRSLGLGKRLINSTKEYAFGYLGLSALFGESNEIGALSFYGKWGGYYRKSSIEEYWRRNSPDQALTYFAADLADPLRRGERYPNGSGIHFAFAADGQATEKLNAGGFLSKDAVLANLP